MPKAAFCRACNSWVWVAPDGSGLCEHGRPSLQWEQECPAVSGVPVPPQPGGTEEGRRGRTRGPAQVVVGALSARPRSSRLAPATTRLCRCTI